MTPHIVERLAELRRHLDHLNRLRGRVPNAAALDADLSLHNDVLYSLLCVCQIVIDISGDISARRNDRFEDYHGAIRSLARDGRFPGALVAELEKLPGFRNVLVHEYVELDMERMIEAINNVDPIERFLDIVRVMEK